MVPRATVRIGPTLKPKRPKKDFKKPKKSKNLKNIFRFVPALTGRQRQTATWTQVAVKAEVIYE